MSFFFCVFKRNSDRQSGSDKRQTFTYSLNTLRKEKAYTAIEWGNNALLPRAKFSDENTRENINSLIKMERIFKKREKSSKNKNREKKEANLIYKCISYILIKIREWERTSFLSSHMQSICDLSHS